MSYYTKREGFDITVGHNRRPVRSLDEAIGRLIPTEEVTRCFSCHATRVTKAFAGPDLTTLVPGVTCERCHGPGAEHIAAMKSGSGKVAIRNPGKLSGNELVWMCGECHRNEPPAGTSFSDPTVTRFQAVGLQLSGCFQESNGAITCTTCHNPHQDIRHDDASFNARCISCHKQKACPVNASSGCVGCHMPKVSPAPNLTFSDHWIHVPKMPPAN